MALLGTVFLAAALPPAGADGPEAGPTMRSLATMDATFNPAKVHGRAVDVTDGDLVYIRIKTPDNLLYTLHDPDGATLGSITASNNEVLFADVSVAKLGTYTLKQDTATISTFNVVNWTSFGDVDAYEVVRIHGDILGAIPTIANFQLDDLLFRQDFGHPPECSTPGTADPSASYTIPSNSLRKVRFLDSWAYPVGPPGPNAFLTFTLDGTDTAWPNIGNNIIWLKNIAAAPSPAPVWNPWEARALVLLQPNTSLDLYPLGEVKYNPPLGGCREPTDDRTVTVTGS